MTESNVIRLPSSDAMSSSDGVASTRTTYSEYRPIEREESDSGDWQVGDLVGEGWADDWGGGNGKFVDREEYDPDLVRNTIKTNYSSWRLLGNILGALVQFWAALAFMYWSLLYRDEDLMNCTAYSPSRPHSTLVRHTCMYTLACLRGFPILAANIVLVLMVRILIQTRLYYSMLNLGVALDFANLPVMRTIWPWVCAVSMFQGGLHFLLKAYFDPEKVVAEMYYRLVRKFVLPGTIFFSFLFRYADIENTLVPLNRIVEQDYHKYDRKCPWLATVQGMNERVFAFDARHRDVIGLTMEKLGKAPSIHDIVVNMIENYDNAYRFWEQRQHRGWGLFRSMWPASVLVDRRLDRQDPETRAWLFVFPIMLGGCAVVSVLSLYTLFLDSEHGWVAFSHVVHAIVNGTMREIDTESGLANVVLLFHGAVIVIFLYRTIKNMFYFAIGDAPSGLEAITSAIGRTESRKSLHKRNTLPIGQAAEDSQNLDGMWAASPKHLGADRPRVGFVDADPSSDR